MWVLVEGELWCKSLIIKALLFLTVLLNEREWTRAPASGVRHNIIIPVVVEKYKRKQGDWPGHFSMSPRGGAVQKGIQRFFSLAPVALQPLLEQVRTETYLGCRARRVTLPLFLRCENPSSRSLLAIVTTRILRRCGLRGLGACCRDMRTYQL